MALHPSDILQITVTTSYDTVQPEVESPTVYCMAAEESSNPSLAALHLSAIRLDHGATDHLQHKKQHNHILS